MFHEGCGDLAGKVCVAAGVVGERVEDRELRGCDSDGEPCRRLWLLLNQRERSGEEAGELVLLARFRLEHDEQAYGVHRVSFSVAVGSITRVGPYGPPGGATGPPCTSCGRGARSSCRWARVALTRGLVGCDTRGRGAGGKRDGGAGQFGQAAAADGELADLADPALVDVERPAVGAQAGVDRADTAGGGDGRAAEQRQRAVRGDRVTGDCARAGVDGEQEPPGV